MSYLKHNISDSESDSESDITTTTDDLTSSTSSGYDTDDEIQINYKAFIDLLEQKLKIFQNYLLIQIKIYLIGN